MRAGCIAGLWALAFCSWAAAADDGASDSVEGQRLDNCVEQVVIDFRYDFDRPEQTLTQQAAALIRTRCGAEIAAYRAKLTPAEAIDPAAFIVSRAYDDAIDLMFHNLAPAALRGQTARRARPGRGEQVLRQEGRFAGFASVNALSGDEVMVISRRDAFKYGSDVSWEGTIADARYSYTNLGEVRWRGGVEGPADNNAGIICGYHKETAKCVATLYSARGWPTPILNLVGQGLPFQAALVCGPAREHLLFEEGSPPASSLVPEIRDVSLILDSGERIALPGGCAADPDHSLVRRILASRSVRATYVASPRKTPIVVESSMAGLTAALALAGHLSSLASDPAATARAWSSAVEAEETVAPFTLRDTLSFSPEWHGALGCLTRGERAVPIRPARGREGACAHWIESLKWRAVLVELNFPAPLPDGVDLAAEREARRKQSEALVRAAAATLLGSGAVVEREPRFAEDARETSVMGRPGWRGFTSRGVGYGYVIGGGTGDAVVPGAFGNRARNTTVHCAVKEVCTVRVPVGGFATLVVATDGSIYGSSVCMETAPGSPRDGWFIRGLDGRYPLRDGCVGDAGRALESILSIYGTTVVHQAAPTVQWQVDGMRAETAMSLAAYLADRLGAP